MTNRKDSPPAGERTRFSIVFSLAGRLTLRLLQIFLLFDLFLCAAVAIAATVHAENAASVTAARLAETGWPSLESQGWLSDAGVRVYDLPRQPEGIKLPGFLGRALPEVTADARRSLEFTQDEDISFAQRINGLAYRVELAAPQDGAYAILVSLGSAAGMAFLILRILLILQLIWLVKSIFSNRRLIRDKLQPIEELAQATRRLNVQEGPPGPEQMEALVGKLQDINAARLDTRIPLDETQDELRGLAGAINGMLERINASYRAQVRFVSDASHELRTPISVIQGYANLLDRWGKNDPKTLQEGIDAIKSETAGMKDMVEQLLFLARGDNNTMALQLACFDLSVLAGQVLQEMRLIDGGHEYESRLAPVLVCADEALIKQALRILVDNAVKYTATGGHISLSVEREDSKARLTVQDDGIGIPPEAVPRIFDRFFRADESRARATGGTGLGLSIAMWIAQRHGGHMEVLSREDIGTRISLLLPAVEDGQQFNFPTR